jgi:nucleoside phosphorylase
MALRVEIAQLPDFVARDQFVRTETGGDLPRVVAVRCGIGPEHAMYATDAAIAAWRPQAVVVAGIAGGLQPDMAPGAVAVLDGIRAAGGGARATRTLSDAVEAALNDAEVAHYRGEGWSVDGIADVQEKLCLGANGELTVDNESYAVLRQAATHGIPATVLRVVADPLGRTVPRSVSAFGWLDGAPWWPNACDLWRLPLEVRGLMEFGRDLRIATQELRRGLAPALDALTRG